MTSDSVERRRFQFGLSQLAISIALVAVSVQCWRGLYWSRMDGFDVALALVFGFALDFAAVGVLFGVTRKAAVCGGATGFALAVVISTVQLVTSR